MWTMFDLLNTILQFPNSEHLAEDNNLPDPFLTLDLL